MLTNYTFCFRYNSFTSKNLMCVSIILNKKPNPTQNSTNTLLENYPNKNEKGTFLLKNLHIIRLCWAAYCTQVGGKIQGLFSLLTPAHVHTKTTPTQTTMLHTYQGAQRRHRICHTMETNSCETIFCAIFLARWKWSGRVNCCSVGTNRSLFTFLFYG